MTNTKKASDLAPGDHLSNTSSRVQTVTTDAGVTIVTFSHTWALPLTFPADKIVTLS